MMKTKERLRSKIWWPVIDRDAERKCKRCIGCQMVTKSDNPPPVKSTKILDIECLMENPLCLYLVLTKMPRTYVC